MMSIQTKTFSLFGLLFLIPTHLFLAMMKDSALKFNLHTMSLADAVFSDSPQQLSQLLHELPENEIKTKINEPDKYGISPLMHAALSYRYSLEKVKLLLDYHPDVNYQDPRGLTAPMLAADVNNIEIVEELLNVDAYDDSVKDKEGKTLADYVGIMSKDTILYEGEIDKEIIVHVPHNKERTDILKKILNHNFEKIHQKKSSLAYTELAISRQSSKEKNKPFTCGAHDVLSIIEKFLYGQVASKVEHHYMRTKSHSTKKDEIKIRTHCTSQTAPARKNLKDYIITLRMPHSKKTYYFPLWVLYPFFGKIFNWNSLNFYTPLAVDA